MRRNSFIAISNHGIMLGGGEYSFHELISRLPPEWLPFTVLPEDGKLFFKLRGTGIESRIIPLPSIRPWAIVHIISSLKSHFQLTRNTRSCLIYANGSRAAFYGGLVGRTLKIPVIWHCRIVSKDPLLDYMLAKLSSCIIVNSQATKMRFRSKTQKKIRVVYNGIDLKRFKEASIFRPKWIQPKWKVILVVARASRDKRHDLVLFAFEKAAGSFLDHHLVCVGPPDASDKAWWHYLQETTSKSAFSNRIHWIGEVDDIRPWYGMADVLVMPSENESFGRVLVEAMAVGVPVVATLGGGVPEIIRHGKDGLLARPGNAMEIADAINKILGEESLKKRLITSAMERAEKFGLDTHVENMIKVFEDVIAEKAKYPAKRAFGH